MSIACILVFLNLYCRQSVVDYSLSQFGDGMEVKEGQMSRAMSEAESPSKDIAFRPSCSCLLNANSSRHDPIYSEVVAKHS